MSAKTILPLSILLVGAIAFYALGLREPDRRSQSWVARLTAGGATERHAQS